ncbi:alcohol dehydrogenase catalytic domain-containing protein [Idiomarina xiamenensis]|uniref:alcohol dehydrogenase catalytic domain-containing protein n=1 Tax=Idiomarina xiamenensis TaxID=1207041 RepID=UPI0002D7752D|nr:alcohol dehydrogenase catalytic domain-containing protein [Idiomarina xiamenensis]
MQAVTIDDKQLYWKPRERPAIAANEVLIKVAYAGINRADLMQAAGQYPPPSGVTDIPGLEVSGEIVECGAEVNGWQAGEKVCALLAGGGYADYVAVPACQVAPIPTGLSVQQAAAICEVYATAWMNGGATRGAGVSACRRQWRWFGSDSVMPSSR